MTKNSIPSAPKSAYAPSINSVPADASEDAAVAAFLGKRREAAAAKAEAGRLEAATKEIGAALQPHLAEILTVLNKHGLGSVAILANGEIAVGKKTKPTINYGAGLRLSRNA